MIEKKLHKHFIAAHALSIHPILKERHKIRASYYYALENFVTQCAENNDFVIAILKKYREQLVGSSSETTHVKNTDATIYSIVNNLFMPWRRKYRYWLLCDFALILSEERAVRNALELLKCYLTQKQCNRLDGFLKSLLNNEDIPKAIRFTKPLMKHYHKNRNFIAQPEKRFLVTANMSSGKSTLINALVGKPVVRTSQGACTANLCYLYNKPFNDFTVHHYASTISLSATHEELMQHQDQGKSCVASYFKSAVDSVPRICLIDTPGVNSALHIEHGELTRESLSKEHYDTIIYVLNGCKLGTDEELRYLAYITDHVPKEKIIFVLNRLDEYRDADDSIESSLEGVKDDLKQLGYDTPKICPVSAYFALLLKMKHNGNHLSEDEADDYNLLAKKFLKPKYDLSRYYPQTAEKTVDSTDHFSLLSTKCGLHGLETILFGE